MTTKMIKNRRNPAISMSLGQAYREHRSPQDSRVRKVSNPQIVVIQNPTEYWTLVAAIPSIRIEVEGPRTSAGHPEALCSSSEVSN
jgi:hypothetical protein